MEPVMLRVYQGGNKGATAFFRNRPLLAPTSFDINTSIQRCLVKAIALHGLGLYIYAGEDLRFITRRIVIAASEDVGLADSNALRGVPGLGLRR